ncbi:MAG: hypothetical protein NT120_02305 [Candidatus Aenigmarchaeota archaeon]|nr:hypothetical protein [Candidatus Aenigmarchaeota archaeon]
MQKYVTKALEWIKDHPIKTLALGSVAGSVIAYITKKNSKPNAPSDVEFEYGFGMPVTYPDLSDSGQNPAVSHAQYESRRLIDAADLIINEKRAQKKNA